MQRKFALLEHLFSLMGWGMLEELRHRLTAYPTLDDHPAGDQRGEFL